MCLLVLQNEDLLLLPFQPIAFVFKPFGCFIGPEDCGFEFAVKVTSNWVCRNQWDSHWFLQTKQGCP